MIQKKINVRVDMKKNRIYCSWCGNISKVDINSYFTEVRFAVADLKPGFSLILDLRECRYSSLEAISVVKKIMQYLVTKGVKDVVRVVSDKHLSRTQFMNMALRAQGYQAVYVNTPEEAEAFIDNAATRHHIRLKLQKKFVEYVDNGATRYGTLQDVSVGGCAVSTAKELPAVGSELLLRFALCDKKMQECRFEFEGKVARHFEAGFGVEFVQLLSADRQKLLECMGQETVVEVKKDQD